MPKVNIRREIFQSDSLSPLLFVICMILLTHVLRKAKARFTLGGEEKIKQCGVIIMNRGKVKSTAGIELLSGEKIREIEENGYKYLGILEYDRVKEQEMKDKFRNEYFRKAKLILKSKLNGKNKIMALNTWAVSILRHGVEILKWNKNELQEMNRKTRKFMTMKENCTREVMLHGCMFLGKVVEEDLLDVKIV